MTKRTIPFSPEVRERAVRAHDGEHGSQWSAIQSIAAKIGCSGETLCISAEAAPYQGLCLNQQS